MELTKSEIFDVLSKRASMIAKRLDAISKAPNKYNKLYEDWAEDIVKFHKDCKKALIDAD